MVHPLLLPNVRKMVRLVLSNILDFFSPQELEKYRLVNLDWNHAACTVLQSKKVISLNSSEGLKNYVSIFSSSIKVLNAFPHSIYNLHYKISNPETITEIVSFTKDFKPYIRNLTVTLGLGFLNTDHLFLILTNASFIETLGLKFSYCADFANFESLQNNFKLDLLLYLKTIKIEVENYESSGESASAILNWIFDSAPNVNTVCHPRFCIPPSKCRIPTNMNLFLSDLILDKDDLPSKNLKRLSCLDFIMKLNEENIPVLKDKKYPVKNLFVDLWNPDDPELRVSSVSMKGLISGLADTLEKLSLDFPWRSEVAYEFRFPLPMWNLTYLSLNGFQGPLLKLLEKLPRLRDIELSQLDLQEILPSAQSFDNFSNVISLRLDFCNSQSSGLLSRLSRIFPNLRKLDVNHAANDVAKMVFQKMKSLTSLRLQGDELTDEGICGIPDDVAKEHKLIGSPPSVGDPLRQYSFIGNLPQLRYLKLEAYRLTEVCIQHGIVHCSTLHFVSMDTRAGKGDPTATVTRKFRLSEYGNKWQGKDEAATIILQEETFDSDDEDAEDFFRKYEKGMLTDLLFV